MMKADALPSAHRRVKPWFREPWPWLLMAGPAIVVVAALYTAWLAVVSDDGVIADDYYRRGLLINKDLERASRGEAMKLGAVLAVAPDGGVRLALSGFEADPAAAPSAVRMRLVHATRAGQDRAAVLTRGPDGRYVGSIAPPPPGRWLVTVETETWRFPMVEAGGTLGEVRLGAARPAD
jgi:uncharacterized protein